MVEVIYSWSANQFQSEVCLDMVTMFCAIDDFCQGFLAVSFPALLPGAGTKKRHHASRLALSEVRTILVWFHASPYRTFKPFYGKPAWGELPLDFPPRPSYPRFVELLPMTLLPLCA